MKALRMRITKAKLFSLLLSLFLLCPNTTAQLTGCASIDLGSDLSVDCADGCVPLSANVQQVGQTTQYEIISIPNNPPYPYDQGTVAFVGNDDIWSEAIDLPFDFCFFGNTYDEIVVGANGVLSFDLWLAGGDCAWAFDQQMPNAVGVPYQNSINGAYHDIDPSLGGEIRYAVLGDYPCRTFIVSFYNVPHYQCNSIYTTQQIVLYETTNIIDVYIEDKPSCNSWNSGNAVIGIQNPAGTIAYVPPNRNTGSWSASNEAWRFSPSGASVYEVTWYDEEGAEIATGDNVEICPTQSTTYTAEVVYDICDGTQVVETDEIFVEMLGEVTTSLTTVVSCDPVSWNNVNYNSTGVYTYTTENSMGCDSVATLDLVVHLATYSISTALECNEYFWNGQTYNESGTYQYISMDVNGCDSVATLELEITLPTSSLTDVEACNEYTWNGTTYTSSGLYDYSELNSVGCDSTATLDLIINTPSFSNSEVYTCEPYTWNGITYDVSGTYEFMTINESGCDSTATLDLSINAFTTSYNTVNACENYSWNGTNYTTSGFYEYNTVNAAGCDSIAFLNLVIDYNSSSFNNATSCEEYMWNEETYYSSGVYTYFTTNSNGCDSLAYLDLEIVNPTASYTYIDACDQFTWNGETYTETGVYSFETVNSVGCDSIVSLDLYVYPAAQTTAEVEVEACNEFTWNGLTYTESGDFIYTTENENGCDSTTTMHLTIYTDNVFLPNVFTPDNDGVNDAFAPVSENVELLKLMVYNRWGNQVFYTESMDEVWDGTYQGGDYLCADGVYTWYISYKCLAERYEKYGHVNLLR